MPSSNFAKHTNLSQHNVIMMGLMSHCHLLRADRWTMWELYKRLSRIIIPCTIMSEIKLIGKVELTMYISVSVRAPVWLQVQVDLKKIHWFMQSFPYHVKQLLQIKICWLVDMLLTLKMFVNLTKPCLLDDYIGWFRHFNISEIYVFLAHSEPKSSKGKQSL